MNAETIILLLKVAVVAVTVLFALSLAALARGNTRLHGRINYVFFGLTIAAVVGLEVVIRVIYPGTPDNPGMVERFLKAHGAREMLDVHLWFSAPAAILLFVMLFTGIKRRRTAHIAFGILFAILWTGTFVTGVFYLPHTAAPTNSTDAGQAGSLSHLQK